MDPSNQTPPPSRSSPSERPTLLTPGSPGATDTGAPTRMLASLERDAKARVGGSTGARRFGKAHGIGLLTVALLAGAGAFFVFAPADDASVRSAAAASARGAATPSPAVSGSSAAAAGPNAASAAAASAPATAQIEPAPPTLAPVVVATAVPSTEAPSASAPAGNPLPALASGHAESPSTAKASASAPGPRGKRAQPKESAVKPPPATNVASTKSGTVRLEASPVRPARKDDEDADTALVAAMIARLDRRGATPGLPATAAVRKDDGPALVESLRQCESKTDPLDARRCRNRACETHWGKADACPAARAPKGSLGAGAERGKPA